MFSKLIKPLSEMVKLSNTQNRLKEVNRPPCSVSWLLIHHQQSLCQAQPQVLILININYLLCSMPLVSFSLPFTLWLPIQQKSLCQAHPQKLVLIISTDFAFFSKSLPLSIPPPVSLSLVAKASIRDVLIYFIVFGFE